MQTIVSMLKLGIEKEHQNAYSIPLFPAPSSTKNMAVLGCETLASCCSQSDVKASSLGQRANFGCIKFNKKKHCF